MGGEARVGGVLQDANGEDSEEHGGQNKTEAGEQDEPERGFGEEQDDLVAVEDLFGKDGGDQFARRGGRILRCGDAGGGACGHYTFGWGFRNWRGVGGASGGDVNEPPMNTKNTNGRLSGIGGEDVFVEDVDVGEVAVVAVVVEAVADDEFIGDFKAEVVGLGEGGSGELFFQQDAGFDFVGTLFIEEGIHGAKGSAGVEDVVDDEDVFAGDVEGVGVKDAGALVGGGPARVAGDGNHVDSHADREVTDEVGDKNNGAGEERHESELAVGVVGGDLLGELIHASLNGVPVNKDVLDVVLH